MGALASGSDAAVDLWVIRLDLDAPTLDVGTSDGWRPGLHAIAEFCRR